jgi:hypothetical protein
MRCIDNDAADPARNEGAFFGKLFCHPRPPRTTRTPGIRAMTDPLGVTRRTPPSPKETPTMPTLTAKGAVKGTVVLEAAELAAIDVPRGEPRLKLTVRIPGVAEGAVGAAVLVDLNRKSARKAIKSIRELGVDNVAVFAQGRVCGSMMPECGLVVQPRKKPEAAADAVPVAA